MAMWFEDFAAGQEFTTPARTVTETDIVSFAAWTGDSNPLHTDAVFAANSRFGERIGHGVYGLSLCLGLISRTGIFEGSAVALLGVDEWRFVAPILIGDTVHCRLTITDTRLTKRGDTGIVGRRVQLLKQDGSELQHGYMGIMMACRPRHDNANA